MAHIWPPRYWDTRIQAIIEAGGQSTYSADTMHKALVSLTGLSNKLSLDDLWRAWLTSTDQLDTSEPFEPVVGADFALPSTMTVNQNVAGTSSNCGVALNADGTLIITCGIFLDDVVEHDLSTAYDLTSASTGTAWDDGANILVRELRFNGDGTYVYYLDEGDDDLSGAALSTPYDLSTAGAISDEYAFTGDTSIARSFEFGNGGLKLYIGTASQATDKILEYDLSSAYDVSTASLLQNKDVDSLTASVNGIAFNQDTGKQVMVLFADSPHELTLGTLTTAWDITTVTFDTVNTLTLAAQPYGLTYGGGHFFSTDFTNSKLLRIS